MGSCLRWAGGISPTPISTRKPPCSWHMSLSSISALSVLIGIFESLCISPLLASLLVFELSRKAWWLPKACLTFAFKRVFHICSEGKSEILYARIWIRSTAFRQTITVHPWQYFHLTCGRLLEVSSCLGLLWSQHWVSDTCLRLAVWNHSLFKFRGWPNMCEICILGALGLGPASSLPSWARVILLQYQLPLPIASFSLTENWMMVSNVTILLCILIPCANTHKIRCDVFIRILCTVIFMVFLQLNQYFFHLQNLVFPEWPMPATPHYLKKKKDCPCHYL